MREMLFSSRIAAILVRHDAISLHTSPSPPFSAPIFLSGLHYCDDERALAITLRLITAGHCLHRFALITAPHRQEDYTVQKCRFAA